MEAMDKLFKWYISGAVSSDKDFRNKFTEAERKLKAEGYRVLNPVKGEKEGKIWSYYMKKDLKKLLKCNGIILLPDWQESEGAKLELSVASQLGYRIRSFDGKTVQETEAVVVYSVRKE